MRTGSTLTKSNYIDAVKAFRERHEKAFPWMARLLAKAKRVLVARGESLA